MHGQQNINDEWECTPDYYYINCLSFSKFYCYLIFLIVLTEQVAVVVTLSYLHLIGAKHESFSGYQLSLVFVTSLSLHVTSRMVQYFW
jgi:hypothetical protein